MYQKDYKNFQELERAKLPLFRKGFSSYLWIFLIFLNAYQADIILDKRLIDFRIIIKTDNKPDEDTDSSGNDSKNSDYNQESEESDTNLDNENIDDSFYNYFKIVS